MKSPDKMMPSFSSVHAKNDASSEAHRQLIGVLGFFMPVLLWLIVVWRPLDKARTLQPLSSISAYYYSGAVSVFAGILVALALFLFTYKGYKNEYQKSDRNAAIVAGIAAILVAFFPTGAPVALKAPFWWTPLIGWIHLGAATILFGSFIFISLFLFTKYDKNIPLSSGKRFRNKIYIFCGIAMAVCIIWVIVACVRNTPIFWPEALALEFFAVSWLVKGRVDITARLGTYYVRHPRKLTELRKPKTA